MCVKATWEELAHDDYFLLYNGYVVDTEKLGIKYPGRLGSSVNFPSPPPLDLRYHIVRHNENPFVMLAKIDQYAYGIVAYRCNLYTLPREFTIEGNTTVSRNGNRCVSMYGNTVLRSCRHAYSYMVVNRTEKEHHRYALLVDDDHGIVSYQGQQYVIPRSFPISCRNIKISKNGNRCLVLPPGIVLRTV